MVQATASGFSGLEYDVSRVKKKKKNDKSRVRGNGQEGSLDLFGKQSNKRSLEHM